MLALALLPARPRVNSATVTRLHDLRRHPLARARDDGGRAAKRAAQQRLQHRQALSSPTTAASCTLSTLPVSAVLKHHLTVLSALGEPATQLVQMLQLALDSGWCASCTTALAALRPRRVADRVRARRDHLHRRGPDGGRLDPVRARCEARDHFEEAQAEAHAEALCTRTRRAGRSSST